MAVIAAFIVAHWGVIAFAAGYILTAGVATMPSPDAPRFSYYQWFYDWTHMMLNKRLREVAVAEQTRTSTIGDSTVTTKTTLTTPAPSDPTNTKEVK